MSDITHLLRKLADQECRGVIDDMAGVLLEAANEIDKLRSALHERMRIEPKLDTIMQELMIVHERIRKLGI